MSTTAAPVITCTDPDNHRAGTIGCPSTVRACQGIPAGADALNTNHVPAPREGECGVYSVVRAACGKLARVATVDRVPFYGQSDPYGRGNVRSFGVWDFNTEQAGRVLVVTYESRGPLDVAPRSLAALFVGGHLVAEAGALDMSRGPAEVGAEIAWRTARHISDVLPTLAEAEAPAVDQVDADAPTDDDTDAEADQVDAPAEADAEAWRVPFTEAPQVLPLPADWSGAPAEWTAGKDVSRLLRDALKSYFPGVKFSVRTDVSTVSIRWTDGPTTAAVDLVAGEYAGQGFDGMQDMRTYRGDVLLIGRGGTRTAYRWGTDFVQTSRESSDALVESMRPAAAVMAGRELSTDSRTDHFPTDLADEFGVLRGPVSGWELLHFLARTRTADMRGHKDARSACGAPGASGRTCELAAGHAFPLVHLDTYGRPYLARAASASVVAEAPAVDQVAPTVTASLDGPRRTFTAGWSAVFGDDNAPAAEAPAAITAPVEYRFDSTEDAYDASQTRDDIRDGDLLIIESERVAGFLMGAYPVAVTAAHGELHAPAPGVDLETVDGGRYAESVQRAHARASDFPQDGDQGDGGTRGPVTPVDGPDSGAGAPVDVDQVHAVRADVRAYRAAGAPAARVDQVDAPAEAEAPSTDPVERWKLLGYVTSYGSAARERMFEAMRRVHGVPDPVGAPAHSRADFPAIKDARDADPRTWAEKCAAYLDMYAVLMAEQGAERTLKAEPAPADWKSPHPFDPAPQSRRCACGVGQNAKVHRVAPSHTPAMLARAEELGAEDYAADGRGAPATNAEIMSMVDGWKVGEGAADVFEAFHRGFSAAADRAAAEAIAAPAGPLVDGADAVMVGPNVYVIVAGNLCMVRNVKRHAGADGWEIFDGGPYVRFVSGWQVVPAVVGLNVCRTAAGGCYCGQTHVTAAELAKLPRVTEAPAPAPAAPVDQVDAPAEARRFTEGRPRRGDLVRVSGLLDTTGKLVTDVDVVAEKVERLGCGCYRIGAARPGPAAGGRSGRVDLNTGCGFHESELTRQVEATPEQVEQARALGVSAYELGAPECSPQTDAEFTALIVSLPSHVSAMPLVGAYRDGYATAAERAAADTARVIVGNAVSLEVAERVAELNPAAAWAVDQTRAAGESLARTLEARTAQAEAARAATVPAETVAEAPAEAPEGDDQGDPGDVYTLALEAYTPVLDSDRGGDLVIEHTHEDGTVLHGGAKGDGTLEIVKLFRFIWRRGSGVHIPASRDRFADLVSIDKAAKALRAEGHTVAVLLDDVWRPAADREEHRAARASARSERLGDRAMRRFGEAEARNLAARRITDGMPFAEPVKIGHHSERAHRAAFERIERNTRASYAARDYAEHLASRAAGAEANEAAKHEPRAIMRRIERLVAEARSWARELADPGTGPGRRRRAELEAEKIAEDIAYQRAKLGDMAAAGAFVAWSREHFQVGDWANVAGRWCEVARVNGKSVSVRARFEWHDRDDVQPAKWDEIHGRRRDGLQWDAPNAEPWSVADARQVAKWGRLLRSLPVNHDRTDPEAVTQRRHTQYARRVVLGLGILSTVEEIDAFGEPADVAGKRARALAMMAAYDRFHGGETFDQVAADTTPIGDTVPAWRMPQGETVDVTAGDLRPGHIVAGVYDRFFSDGERLVRQTVGPVESVPVHEDRRESGEWCTVKINGTVHEMRSFRRFAVHQTGRS